MALDEEIVVFESEDAAEAMYRDLTWVDRQRRAGGPPAGSVAPRDLVHVRVTGAKDATTKAYPGVVTWRDLTVNTDTWYDGDAVHVLAMNEASETLVSGTRYRGLVEGERDGKQVVIVSPGGGVVVAGFDAVITGSGGSPLAYSWSEAEMTSAGTWAVKSGGLSGVLNAYRAPSNNPGTAAPTVPNNQYVRMRPSAKVSGKYEFDAPGGMFTFSIELPQTWNLIEGDPCTVGVATTKTLTITARDGVVTWT